MARKRIDSQWSLVSEPNEDREGENVYIDHVTGDCASLACAQYEGETASGLPVPVYVIDAAWEFIYDEEIDY